MPSRPDRRIGAPAVNSIRQACSSPLKTASRMTSVRLLVIAPRALIGVTALRAVKVDQGLPRSFDAEVRRQRSGQPMADDLARELVNDGEGAPEAARHRGASGVSGPDLIRSSQVELTEQVRDGARPGMRSSDALPVTIRFASRGELACHDLPSIDRLPRERDQVARHSSATEWRLRLQRRNPENRMHAQVRYRRGTLICSRLPQSQNAELVCSRKTAACGRLVLSMESFWFAAPGASR